jgi:hypothetical protein
VKKVTLLIEPARFGQPVGRKNKGAIMKNTTEVYRFAARDGRDQGSLLVAEVPGRPDRFIAAVWYWDRKSDPPTLSPHIFPTKRDMKEARSEAESWIRSNLFPDYVLARI